MDDLRRQFILNIAALHLNITLTDVALQSFAGTNVVEDFLETKTSLIIFAYLEDADILTFSNKLPNSTKNIENLVILNKNQKCALTEENIRSVLCITAINGPATTALYSLNNAFLPLLQHENEEIRYSNISRNFANLQNDLRSLILKRGLQLDEDSTLSLAVVTTIGHELEYWNNLSNTEKKSNYKNYVEIFKPLSEEIGVLETMPLGDVENVLDNAHNYLDDLWRQEPPYPKGRMKHIMDIIAEKVADCVIKHLRNSDLLEKDYNTVRDMLTQCISISETWVSTCVQLTQVFWPNYSLHTWTDSPHSPEALGELISRLKEILSIRTIHKQIIRLLTNTEQKDLNTNEMFQPFKDTDLLNYGSHRTEKFLAAKKLFEYLLQPAEERVASKLKKQLSGVDANVRQLIHEYGRYSELISRPVVKSQLQSERQYLLKSLNDYLKLLQNEAASGNATNISKYEISQIVQEITAVRQLETKGTDMQTVAEKLLNDLQGYDHFTQKISEFLKEIKQQHSDLFDSWTVEITSQIESNKLRLRETDPVVKFSSNKLMTVNYSPRFVTLTREVRQLSALGYRVPSNILEVNEHAKQFVKFAKILEQIAHFHNTIGDRMIKSQRPMMLASAINLSKLVQEEEVVSWGKIEAVEKYVNVLKEAVEKLASENNLLTSYHLQILEKIKELEDADLLKDYEKWRKIVKFIKDIIVQVESKGFRSTNLWKEDIDKSLSVVLGTHYLKSLHSIHSYLPEIYAELIYRNSQLQFSPDQTKLREKYEQQLNRFIDIPKTFRGVSDAPNSTIFADIIARNEAELSKVEKRTNEIFEQLHGVINHWRSWVSLEALDSSKLKQWQDWDLNFRASKAFGQEIAKLPSTEEKVGCFIVGLSRLRSDLESHNRSYWDQLVSTLKDSIAEDVVKLQHFVDSSTSALTKHPASMEQLGEHDMFYADILKCIPEMEALYAEMTQKAQTLSSWSRERVDSVARLVGAWERLQSLLENYQYIMAKQIETFKTTLNINSENLKRDIERFSAKWDQIKPRPSSGQIMSDSFVDLQKHLENIKGKREQWQEVIKQKEKLTNDYAKFALETPDFTQCEEIEVDLKKQEYTWEIFEEFSKGLEELSKEEWIVFRKKMYRLDDFLLQWKEKLQNETNSPLASRILQEIHKYEEALPVLKCIRGEDFTEKHWIEVFSLLEVTPKAVDTIALKDFLSTADKLIENSKSLSVLSKRAASEIVVRQALSELDQWDVHTKFAFSAHLDSSNKEVFVVKEFKEILNKVGDNQSLLQSVKNSADYDSFSERAEIWEKKLTDLDKLLTTLAQIQRKWVYLEPIFQSGTLEKEKARFLKIDKEFRNLLTSIEKDPRVSSLLRYPNARSVMENLQNQLSRCQQSLDEFLTEKRNRFPRFLFLGDDDLLEVVGQSSKEKVIQAHLKKIFAGINSIVLDQQCANIVAICSVHGEKVHLDHPVKIERPVEDWLNVLVLEMQSTLKNLLVRCSSEGKSVDPLKYPSQILCLTEGINFTTKCEQAIASLTLPPLLANYKAELSHYISSQYNDSGDKSLGPFSSLSEDGAYLTLKLKSLILDFIYYIKVLEELIDANVTSASEWIWQKQLRYHCDSKGDVTVKMANSTMDYSFEYLGNYAKIVRTPLTDKCFLTLAQGMHLGMGGNPYGPAGTGKTESVKALGCLLGRQVLVFNCDEGIDATSMGRILTGLVRCGAWGCFDEFNRLDEATLSTISMYLQPIQLALKMKNSAVAIMNQKVPVNKHCGIFVTLNPASGSYGGRNKLPDNLKQLFRPAVMTHPDHEQIACTLLRCDGYTNADAIGKKIVEVFTCASKLLSHQQHYDWGLRAIRTTLHGCSSTIKQYKRDREIQEEFNIDAELELVVQAIRTDTLSKLTYSDSIKFDKLLSDVFSGIQFSKTDQEDLTTAVREASIDLGYVVNERQIMKCVELFEQLKQRMGVVLVGPSGSGKSTIRNILFHTLKKIGKNIKQYVFNPKSMPRHQLLGYIDTETRQWTDGILTLHSVQVTSEPAAVTSWIVCDGDVDPEWIESLNSVLDDNRLLTLPSGWRIQFGTNVNFIFETDDLSYASPATVSRMGIVYMSEDELNLDDYSGAFLTSANDDEKLLLGPLINEYFHKVLSWVIKKSELSLNRSKFSIAKTAFSHLIDRKNKADFVIGLIDGFASQVIPDYRNILAQNIFEWTEELIPQFPSLAYYNKSKDMVDIFTTDHSFVTDITNECEFELVPTATVLQTLNCLKIWITEGKEQHFLLVGEHGSAKRLILEHLVKERCDIDFATVHCSSNVTPEQLINKISQHCIAVNTNKGKILKSRKSHFVLYIRNIHLLRPDRWGTNMLIEFLQQVITYKGFFDSANEWIGLENISIVGSTCPSNLLSTRFCSSLHIYTISVPEGEDLVFIFTAYLTAVIHSIFSVKNEWNRNKISKLAASMISIYNEVKETFTFVDNILYTVSPHDLTKWCRGLLRYFPESEVDTEKFLLEIVYYEAINIFGDKLTSEVEKHKLKGIISNYLQRAWGFSVAEKLSNNDVFYVPTLKLGNSTKKTYMLTKATQKEWSNSITKGIHIYERDGQNINIHITMELLNLNAKVAKGITCNKGHLLLIGKSGIGRKVSLKILSSLYSHKLIIPISDSSSYFNNDLKQAMQSAAVENEIVYFVLQDHMLLKQGMASLVNTLMLSGEAPGLYNSAEIDSLVAGLKDEAGQENFEGNLMQFFAERVNKNLRVIACLDADDENLSVVLEHCPALKQETSVVWMTQWSSATMEYLPEAIIEKFNESKETSYQIQPSKKFYQIYETIQTTAGDPVRYISLINLYATLYLEKLKALQQKQTKLRAGVSKLTDAKNVVAKLKESANEQKKKLAEKQAKANSALDMITSTMENANDHKEKMENVKQQTEKENALLIKRKKEIELELAEVEPLVQEARAAVGNIKTEALSEIRSLRAPPDVIRDILEGVLRLMGIQDTSWNSMKTFLAKRGAKEDIRSFDAGRISTENRQAVEKLMAAKPDSFDMKTARRASIAAAPLAAWVAANVKYSRISENIRPLEKEQMKLKQNLQNAELQLEELSTGLMDVDAKVASLKGQLSTYTKEAAEVEIQLNKAQSTLAAAEGLVEKLNEEYERWQQQIKELTEEIKYLPKNCLLASALITYLSNSSEDERKQMTNKWAEIVDHNKFSLQQFVSSEREQMQWQGEGLPSDLLSVQNAIIMLKGNICPFVQDPSSVAVNWLKTHHKNKNVEVTTQESPKFNTTLDLAVRFGKVLILEDVDCISATLLPILRREFVFQGERKLISINGKLVDYHPNFILILSSRNPNVKISKSVSAYVNAINFSITNAGLTEQLITNAIKQENPSLEERRHKLLRAHEEYREKLDGFQDKLLEDLANSTGNMLEDENLLVSLDKTKTSSIAIQNALGESKHLQSELQKEYEAYKDFSDFSSNLYFAVHEFAKTNVLYLLSVSSYTRLFLKALSSFGNKIKDDPNQQQKSLIQTLYQYMSRGILRNSRLEFALHLVHKMYPKHITDEEWKLFLGSSTHLNKEDTGGIPLWIPDQYKTKAKMFQLVLPDLYTSLKLEDFKLWSNFMEQSQCENNFPTHYKFSEFQKVLITQLLRPDKLHTAITLCVMHLTGLRTLHPDVLHIAQILKETQSSEPILLITTAGNDPSNEIIELAVATLGSDKYKEIAMGQGQEAKAISALQDAAKSGQWLILKNLHLVTSWLPLLCQSLQNLPTDSNFRLWLVTEPHTLFSPVLAQQCLKIAYEPPEGVKYNLLRNYAAWGQAYIDKLNPTGARIFFVIACLHAILQERRTFIPQGWLKWYEFSDVDFTSAVKLAEDLWTKPNAQVQWKFLIGLLYNAIYGGRIDSIVDLKVLKAYLETYFVDEILSHRWKPLNLQSSLPTSANYQEYVRCISLLNNNDVPSYFILPENIIRAWEKNTSSQLILHLKELHISKAVNSQFNRKIWQKFLSPFMSLWKKLNQGQDFIKNEVPHEQLSDSIMLSFIADEFRKAIILIHFIHKSFTALSKVIKGSGAPEDHDFCIATKLMSQETPSEWLKLWSGPKDPSRYLNLVLEKTIYLSKLKSSESDIFRKPLKLGNFFNPDGFLIAYKQEFARKSNVTMDQLVLRSVWKSSATGGNNLTLTGLLIEGATFNGTNLAVCTATSENIDVVPDCSIIWMNNKQVLTDSNFLEIPVYFNSSREEQLTVLQVPCSVKDADRWILNGVAFLLDY